MKLLELLFDDSYYLSNTAGAIGLDLSFEEAFTRYQQHSIAVCFPPNEYFAKGDKNNLIYEPTSDTKDCLLEAWSIQDMGEKYYPIFISFAQAHFSKAIASLERLVKRDQADVEALLGKNTNMNILVVRALASVATNFLKEKSIDYIWQTFDKIPQPVLVLIRKQVLMHDSESEHGIKLVASIQSLDCHSKLYGGLCDSLPKNFLEALTKSNKSFQPEVFKSFEAWYRGLRQVGYEKNRESIAKLLSAGIERELYEPNLETIEIFKDYAVKNEELSYLSIATALDMLFEQEKVGFGYVTEVINLLSKHGQPVSLQLLDYLVDHYISDELKDLELLAKLVEINTQAPGSIWSRLTEATFSIVIEESRPKILPYTTREILDEFANINSGVLQEYLELQFANIVSRNARSNYQLRLAYNKEPEFVRRGSLYVYMGASQIICKLRAEDGSHIKLQLNGLNKKEFEGLQSLLLYQKPLQLEDIRAIEQESGYLTSWRDEDFLNWRQSTKDVTDENIAEVISVLAQAMHIKQFKRRAFVRDCQILAVLNLFKSDKGRLVQVGTGEGKTEIIAMFAAIKILQARKVDISTSSDALAIRDAENLAGFYNVFGISVSHNIGGAMDEGKECYLADIVYGEPLFFIGDSLYDISKNTKLGRAMDVLIVDESDNMFLDQTNLKVRLSGAVPGFEALRQMLVYSYNHFQGLLEFSYGNEDRSYVYSPKINEASGQIEFNTTTVNQPYSSFLQQKYVSYTTSILDLDAPIDSRKVVIPTHLEAFLTSHISSWGHSIFASRGHEENKHYRVQEATRRKKKNEIRLVVAPIDHENTGQIQEGVQWNNGLHQFLQLKHGLPLTQEGLVDVFMSYVGYVLKYTNLYGLTATLGTEDHKNVLQEVYGADSRVIPSFIQKKLYIYEPLISFGQQDWLDKIVESSISIAIEEERSVLIIVHTIKAAEEIYNMLKEAGHPKEKLFKYIDGTTRKETEQSKNKGDIVVGTYIAGRGTDIKISRLINSNGGLHVIITDYPTSIRVHIQQQGRAARKDENGSVQMILDAFETYPDCHGNLDCYSKMRASIEANSLKEMMLCHIPYMKLDDEFFDRSVRLVRMVESPTGYDLAFAGDRLPQELREDTIYVYVKYGKEVHLISPFKDYGLDLDITESLRHLDEQAVTRIVMGAKRSGGGRFTFNRQDFELIQFIAALNGHDLQGKVIARVVVEYERLNGNEAEPEEVRKKKLFTLWQENLKVYSRQYEIKQMQELFAIWLKGQSDLALKDKSQCNITTPELEKQKFEARASNARESFIRFEAEAIAALRNETLMKNSAHLIKRAFALQAIHARQLQNNSFSEKIQLRHKYQFQNKEPRSTNKLEIQVISNNGVAKAKEQDNSFLGGLWSYVAESVSHMAELITGSIRASEVYIQSPLDKAVSDLDRAISLEPNYNWPSHDAMSYMRLVRDGADIVMEEQANDAGIVKQRFVDDAAKAKEKLLGFEMPKLEQELSFYLLTNLTQIGSAVSRDYILRMKVFEKLANRIETNINITSGSGQNQMIRVGEILSLESLVNAINVTDQDEQEFANKLNLPIDRNASRHGRSLLSISSPPNTEPVLTELYASGALLFTITTYDLESEEDDGWFGNVFAGLIGLMQIGIGVVLMSAGGPFCTLLGSSFIMQGLGDTIMVIENVLTGKSVNLDGYMKAKGIGVAISIITASIGAIGINAGIIPNPGALNPAEFMPKAITTALITNLGSKALTKLGDKLVKSNDEELESRIREQVEAFISEHEQQLAIICASQAYSSGQASCSESSYNAILENANKLIQKHVRRYHGDAQTIAKGVASGVFGLAVSGNPIGLATYAASAGIDAGIGLFEATSSTDYVLKALSSSVASQASSSTTAYAMFLKDLTSSYTTDTSAIYQELTINSWPTNTNQLPCQDLDTIKLSPHFEPKRSGIKSICDKVSSLFTKTTSQAAKSFLSNSLTQKLLNRMRGIISTGFVQPTASFAASALAAKVNQALEEHKAQQRAQEQLKAHTKRQEKSERNQQTISSDSKNGPWRKADSKASHNGHKLLSFEEFKSLKLKESPIYSSMDSHLLDHGFSYLEVMLEPSAISEAEINSYLQGKYQNYLNGRPLDKIEISTVGLHAHLFAEATTSIKHTAQKHFPEASDFIDRSLQQVSNGWSYIGGKTATAVDRYLDYWLTPVGNAYAKAYLKEALLPLAIAINDYASDLTPTTREAFKDAFRLGDLVGTAKIAKGLAHLTTEGIKAGARTLATSNLPKDLTRLSSLRATITPDGIPIIAFLDDPVSAICKNPNALFFADDAITKAKPGLWQTTADKIVDATKSTAVKSINVDEVANKIANGHAFEKHVLGKIGKIPGVETREQLVDHIKRTINNADDIKIVTNNRVAYWHEKTKTIVTIDPSHPDGGSVFKSNKEYFNKKIV